MGGLLGAFAARLGLGDFFGDLRIQFIELGIAQADEMQVAALEGAEFGAEVRGTQFAVGEFGLDGELLLALEGELLLLGLNRFNRDHFRRFGSHTRSLKKIVKGHRASAAAFEQGVSRSGNPPRWAGGRSGRHGSKDESREHS